MISRYIKVQATGQYARLMVTGVIPCQHAMVLLYLVFKTKIYILSLASCIVPHISHGSVVDKKIGAFAGESLLSKDELKQI